MKHSTLLKLSVLLLVLTSSFNGFSQAACTANNYTGATVIPANGYPWKLHFIDINGIEHEEIGNVNLIK